jgi:hypothetical protein
MKKEKIIKIIKETVESKVLTNLNEDSFYDGHKFIEYGKNIENVSIISPTDQELSIDKNSLIINWGVKFIFRNSGIESVIINILNIDAKISNVDDQEIQFNSSEFEIEIFKEKLKNNDISIYINSVEIDLELKKINVVVSI